MLKKPFIISDTELWDKFVDGDSGAYQEIYERCFDELFSYGVKFTFDHNLVMDCIQDLFIDLYNYRPNLKRTEKIIPYLLISLKHKIAKKTNSIKSKSILISKAYRLSICSRKKPSMNQMRNLTSSWCRMH